MSEILEFKFVEEPPSYDAAEVFYVRVDPSIGVAGELIRSLYYQLWLPGYFGFNWDALYDCLRDLDWIPCKKIVLLHMNLPNLPRVELRVYLQILRDAVLDHVDDGTLEIEVVFMENDKHAIEHLLGK